MKKRFLALFMTFVMMFTLIPVDAFATDAVDTPSGVVVEATQEEVPENTETETPVVEEPVLDPVQQLYDALMACATYEELDAYMEAMSEEDYVLMAQFTDEQNAALTAKIQQLQENDVELLANRSFRFYWSDEVKADVASIDIISGGNTYNVPNSTNSGTYNVDDRDIQVRINYASGADDTYRAYVSWDMWDGRYEVEFSRNTVIFQHLDIKIESEAPITIKHKTVNMITGAVVGEETRTIAADIDAVHSITFAGVTYDDFEDAPGGDTDTRIDGLRIKLPTINESTTATIILDLRDEEGTLYEDVVINYNYAGIQEAMRSCDSWGQNTGGYGYGIDFVPANGSSNTYTIEYTQYVIPVEKIWDDNNNQDGIRPDSVTIALYANGTQVDTIALNAESEWKGQFENKPSHTDAGAVITYTIDETSVPAGYTKTGVGNNGTYLTVTNAHTPEEITIRGTKTWEDNNNQDGIRPDSITVNLLANGTVVDTAEAKASEGWTYEFTAPKYAAGREIAYSVSEETVEGYKPTVNGYDITNSHTPATTEATIVKVWDDAENQDGKRPAELKVTLSNGTVVTLNEANGWEATVKDLPKYAAGNEIAYTWTEAEVGGYKLTDNKTEGTVTTLTNTHEVEKTSVTVTKVWDDADNQDGKRPASITINLLANGVVAQTATVTAENGWEYTFENLDKFAAGEEIVYTVTEDKVSDYTTAVDGFTVTNTHTPETVEVSGTKTWVDADDQDGKRPASITINLLANGKEFKSVEVTEKTNWEFTFTDLPKYEAGTEIVYTITEEAVDGYTTEIKDFDVTNTHTPEETEVTVTKVWDDNNNQDGIRPANVTVRLYADGTEVGSATLAGEWTYTFENLDKYAKGKEIVYTVSEDAVTGYEATVDGFTITNKHTPETIEISGGKTWDDADNQDGIRPETITINLLADGEVIDTVDVKDGKWSFTNLPKFKDGKEIVYTITEEPVEGYTATVDGFNVTNKHEVEKTEVTVNKVWDDADNQDGIRPESITVNLLANGEVVKTAAVTAEEEWTYTFTDLDKYADGQEIEYTVEEAAAVEGYEATVEGLVITNTHTPATVEVSGGKTWDDADNQDGIRPESITINLLADGEVIDSVDVKDGKWSFTDLPKFKDGVEIVYTITEEPVEGYETTVDGFNVTNKHEVEKTEVTVTKEWDDADNQDGIRPESITVNLLANGEVVKTATVTAEEEWTYTFTDLDKYAAGQEIEYTVEEVAVEGYEATVDGLVITNTHTPEVITIEGTKTWDDADNQDGIRPETITINLLADGEIIETVEVTDDSWKFEDLPKFRDGGVEIVYTITEEPVEGYETTVDGFNVTNKHIPEVITISGEKVWEDADNQDGKRPESITINLLANGEKVGSTTVTAGEGGTWTFEFVDVPKFEAGEEIVYTVTEEAVDGYTATVDGFTVTNTHTPEQTSVTVNKVWVDDDNNDGIRPESVTINLLNGETVVDTAVLNEENQWTYIFEELDKYAAGVEIEYTVEEEAVEGYTDAVTEGETGFVVTNTHESKVIGITVNKVWKGGTGKSATIKLYANGEEIDSAELTAETEWTHTFENLKVYADGEEIVYTVDETDVPANYRKSVKLDTVDETTGNRVYTVTNTKNDPYIPPTNEGGNTTMWMGIMTASLLAMGGLTVVYKKRY